MSNSNKRFAKFILGLFAVAALGLFARSAVYAQGVQERLDDAVDRQGAELQQDVREPALEVPIPDVQFSKAVFTDGSVTVPFLAQYIAGVYRFLISIVGVLASVMMMIGGFQYLTAGGDKAKVDAGKKRVVNALAGMVLAFGSYVLLYAINPDLVSFESLRLAQVQPIGTVPYDEGDVGRAEIVSPSQPIKGRACSTIEECRALCAQDPSTWPTTTDSVLDPNLARTIPNLPNLLNPKGVTAGAALIQALDRVNFAAQREGVVVNVSSGYRPLKRQIEIVCSFLRQGRASEIGSIVAWPGGSNHGSGKAIDIWLTRSGKAVTTTSSAGQSGGQWREGSILLDRIMTEAGFRRYCKEMWHYEYETSNANRCTTNCPFPPRSC